MSENSITIYDAAEISNALRHTMSADTEEHPEFVEMAFSTSADLTPIQRKIFDLLADGEAHGVPEILQKCIGRRFVSKPLVRTHISKLRIKLAGSIRIDFVLDDEDMGSYQLAAVRR